MRILSIETMATSSAVLMMTTAVIAAWNDWTSWRIPNQVIAGGAAAALMLAMFGPDAASVPYSLLGGLVGLAIFLPLYMVKGMAAGDVKLMAVLGMFSGPSIVIDIALFSCLIGGVWALIAIHLNKPVGLISWAKLQVTSRITNKESTPSLAASGAAHRQKMIPYGVVIAMGSLISLL